MSLDNLEIIKPFLKFKSEDDFYYLQILARKKENPNLGSNSRVIKNYYIRSYEHLIKIYDEVKQLCHVFNARAMLRLNKRSFYNVGFKTLINLSSTMANKDFKNLKNQYDKACGQGHNAEDKTWIVDLDNPVGSVIPEAMVEHIIEHINTCHPEGEKVLTQIKSLNGIHLITRPFNTKTLKNLGYDIDIHKDNPTNLYIP